MDTDYIILLLFSWDSELNFNDALFCHCTKWRNQCFQTLLCNYFICRSYLIYLSLKPDFQYCVSLDRTCTYCTRTDWVLKTVNLFIHVYKWKKRAPLEISLIIVQYCYNDVFQTIFTQMNSEFPSGTNEPTNLLWPVIETYSVCSVTVIWKVMRVRVWRKLFSNFKQIEITLIFHYSVFYFICYKRNGLWFGILCGVMNCTWYKVGRVYSSRNSYAFSLLIWISCMHP